MRSNDDRFFFIAITNEAFCLDYCFSFWCHWGDRIFHDDNNGNAGHFLDTFSCSPFLLFRGFYSVLFSPPNMLIVDIDFWFFFLCLSPLCVLVFSVHWIHQRKLTVSTHGVWVCIFCQYNELCVCVCVRETVSENAMNAKHGHHSKLFMYSHALYHIDNATYTILIIPLTKPSWLLLDFQKCVFFLYYFICIHWIRARLKL